MEKLKVSLLPVFLLGIFFGIGSCTTSPSKNSSGSQTPKKYKKHPPPPKDYKPQAAKLIEKITHGQRPFFSQSETKILYISRDRKNHRHTQVYEYDFFINRERRVTFHDGLNIDAIYSTGGQKIIYSSTTDEIKEQPNFIKTALTKIRKTSSTGPSPINDSAKIEFPPTELYMSDFDGHKITRLTNHVGFDGYATFDPRRERLVFSRQNKKGFLNLYSLNIRNKKTKRMTKGSHHDLHAQFSPTGKQLIWERRDSELEPSGNLWISNSWAGNPRELLSNPIPTQSPSWHPDGKTVVFSSNHADADNFELYVVEVEGECVKRLTYHASQDSEPHFSPDGKKLVFTSDRNGLEQVFVMDYVPPKSCSTI